MKLFFDLDVIRLAFRTVGVALVIIGIAAGAIEDKNTQAAAIVAIIGFVVICLTAIYQRRKWWTEVS